MNHEKEKKRKREKEKKRKREKEKKTFSMRMVLNVVGLFAFIGMTVGAYTQAYYLDEHLELLRFAYMTALEWKEFFCLCPGRPSSISF
ncbi:hypothetical protein Q8846_18435 [Bacillus licheniformis]|uniref:hypothetical protein n=1 Tax=Bacillus licheniformis TaxID=1402 RepID=UPI00232AF50B|nr:hypothetical protein [Bacillus licheniformis]